MKVNNCMIKNDFGIIFFLLITEYMINQDQDCVFIILDTVLTFSVGILIKIMKKVVKLIFTNLA